MLPVRLQPTDAAQPHVRFTNPQTSDTIQSDAIQGDLIDLSRGGVGFMSGRFLPRGTSIDLRICGLDGDPTRAVLVARARVQRIRMTDSRPAYLIGAAFIERDPVFERDLELLLNRLTAALDDASGTAEPEVA